MKQAIEYLLFKSGVSNYQIAKITGISAVVLSKYATGKSEIGNMSLDNAIKIYDYFKELLKMAKTNFGTVTFEGKEYILQNQAEPTSRALNDWQRDEGYAHFAAPAVDAEGNQYQVEWVLKTVYESGEGIEDLGELDWDDVDAVIAI